MPSQCAENIMTVFDLLMALFMGTKDNGEYVQNVIYSGSVLLVQKQKEYRKVISLQKWKWVTDFSDVIILFGQSNTTFKTIFSVL